MSQTFDNQMCRINRPSQQTRIAQWNKIWFAHKNHQLRAADNENYTEYELHMVQCKW